MNYKKQKKGFTLIELLLSITIFMAFMTVITGTFLDIIRSQKTANETRLMYSELRTFVDYVSSEMREGKIDYFCYQQDQQTQLDFFASSLTRCTGAAGKNLTEGDVLRTISADGLSSSILKYVPGDGSKEPAVCLSRYRNVNGAWQLEAGYGDMTQGGTVCENGFKEFAFANLRVKSMRFEIIPTADPQAASSQKDLALQLKPMIRLYLDVGSKNDNVKFDLQYQTLLTARN